MGLDRDLGFSRGHQGHQPPDDDGDEEEDDDVMEDNNVVEDNYSGCPNKREGTGVLKGSESEKNYKSSSRSENQENF